MRRALVNTLLTLGLLAKFVILGLAIGPLWAAHKLRAKR